MFWFKLIKKFIKILNADASPSQIAGGIALGSIIGFTPFFSLHNILVFVLIVLVEVNITSALFSVMVFGMIGWLIDPLSNQLGYFLLVRSGGLTSFWTYLYNVPVLPLTRFNNTLVLGSFIVSLVLFVPLLIFTKKGVIFYRSQLKERLEKMRIFQIMKASKVYNWYQKIKKMGI